MSKVPSTVEVPKRVSLSNHCSNLENCWNGGRQEGNMAEVNMDLGRGRLASSVGLKLARLSCYLLPTVSDVQMESSRQLSWWK